MATRTITETDCDRCDKKNVPVHEFRMVTHTVSDPAGGHSEECGLAFDLCASCMYNLLNNFTKSVERKDVKSTIAEMKIKRTREW